MDEIIDNLKKVLPYLAEESRTESKIILRDEYEEVLSRREIDIDEIRVFFGKLFNYMPNFVINGKRFYNPTLYYDQPQRGKIYAKLYENLGGREVSQDFIFTPYGVRLDNVPDYMFDVAKLNKIFMEGIRWSDENYVKDYVDYLVSSYVGSSEFGLMQSVAQRLAFIKRYPYNLYEFATNGYNTENIESTLGHLLITNPLDVKNYFREFNELSREIKNLSDLSQYEFYKYYSDRVAEINQKFDSDKLAYIGSKNKYKNFNLSDESILEICRDFVYTYKNSFANLKQINLDNCKVKTMEEDGGLFHKVVIFYDNRLNKHPVEIHLNIFTAYLVSGNKAYSITPYVREAFVQKMRAENGYEFDKSYGIHSIIEAYKKNYRGELPLEENTERLKYMLSLVDKKPIDPEKLIKLGLCEVDYKFTVEPITEEEKAKYNLSIGEIGLSFLNLNKLTKHYEPKYPEYKLSYEDLIKICKQSIKASEAENPYSEQMKNAKFTEIDNDNNDLVTKIEVLPKGLVPFCIYFSPSGVAVKNNGKINYNCIALNKLFVKKMLSKYPKKQYKKFFATSAIENNENFPLYNKAKNILRKLAFIDMEPVNLAGLMLKKASEFDYNKDLQPLDAKYAENLPAYFEEIEKASKLLRIMDYKYSIERKPEQETENDETIEPLEEIDFELLEKVMAEEDDELGDYDDELDASYVEALLSQNGGK